MALVNGDDVHYPPFTPGVPPATPTLLRAGEWWGCVNWLVKAEFYAEGEATVIGTPGVVAMAEECLSSGVDPDLRPARMGRHSECGTAAYIPVGADERFAIDPLFRTYVEAVASVERWLWLPGFGGKSSRVNRTVPEAGILAGTKDGELVAVISAIDNRESVLYKIGAVA